MTDGHSHQKSGKASFDDIYNAEDPRGYFTELGKFGYETPDHGRRIFPELLSARSEQGLRDDDSAPHKVVDVCCSYGINGALLKYDITMDDLYDRYRSSGMSDLTSEQLVASDREFYSSRRRDESPEVVGVDISENAVDYAVKSGMLDAGFAENLEDEDISGKLRESIGGVDLLTVTGGIGYISERTFDRLLAGMKSHGDVPWVASFALRWVSYKGVAETLADYGLVTEKLAGHTFPQRRFADDEERDYVIEELTKMDIDVSGKESEGLYHAEFYLSRTPEEVEAAPLASLLEAVTGTP